MAATKLIAMHQNKGRSVMRCLKDRTDYAMNGEKTDEGKYISSYQCNPELVDLEFAQAKKEYLHKTWRQPKGDVIAYQIRQSFKPGEITPEEANEVGYETGMRFTKGKHAFIVATHVERAHIHNHIIFNSTNLKCDRKLRDFWFSGIVLQRLSDIICLEHGLSVIPKVKPSERQRRTKYPERVSMRDFIWEDILKCLDQKPADFEELLKLLQAEGYEIKRGKHTAVCGKEQKRFIRFRSFTIINGQMRVDLESFEKWYANQVKHKKVNGEDPGAELTKKSYSFRDAANLLGIHSSNLYEIWREEKLETFTVDFTKRIPIEVFEKWYENQIMYQKVGKMPTITDLQADFIPLHEAAALLGITKEKMSVITRASRFKDCFEIQVFEDKKWISKKSFQHFLNAQSVYQVVKESGPVKQNNQESMETKEYISRSEAAALAGVTSGTITKWMQMERFSCVGAGKVLRINRKEFLQWLKEYQEGAG